MIGGVFVWSIRIRMVQGCELYLRVKMYDCTMPLPRPRLYPCTLPIDISYMYRYFPFASRLGHFPAK